MSSFNQSTSSNCQSLAATLPSAVIRMKGEDSFEGRVVTQAALMLDIPVKRLGMGDLASSAGLALDVCTTLPVGSVEFVRAVMSAAGVAEPPPMSYPDVLVPFLQRRVQQVALGEVRSTHCFVKPVTTKLFTGIVIKPPLSQLANAEHELEQFAAVATLPDDTPVWVSAPVRFVSEWRYYVLDCSIIGAARYDPDGADGAPGPDLCKVRQAVAALAASGQAPAAYALDFGVLESGETALVEANDGWALGLYGSALEPKGCLRFLTARWNQLSETTRERDSRPARIRRNRP